MDRLGDVLLVEDNPGDAMFVQSALQRLDPELPVTHVVRVRDAIEKLAKHPFGLVLLDLHLPDSRGVETFERILASAKGVPVVVLTDADDKELALQAISSGVQDYLVKGTIDGSTLRRSIRYATERNRLEVELQEANRKLADLMSERAREPDRSVTQEIPEHEQAERESRVAGKRLSG